MTATPPISQGKRPLGRLEVSGGEGGDGFGKVTPGAPKGGEGGVKVGLKLTACPQVSQNLASVEKG
jgi:hypothetical protein